LLLKPLMAATVFFRCRPWSPPPNGEARTTPCSAVTHSRLSSLSAAVSSQVVSPAITVKTTSLSETTCGDATHCQRGRGRVAFDTATHLRYFSLAEALRGLADWSFAIVFNARIEAELSGCQHEVMLRAE
jgi:hypothetical protein